MAITNGYATLAQAREVIGMPATDTSSDGVIERMVESASRWIDAYTGRTFWVTASETRYYMPTSAELVVIDDAATITAVALDDGSRTYATALASTDYDADPPARTSAPVPIMALRIAPLSGYAFTVGMSSVRVTGTWGVPSGCAWMRVVTEACLLQVSRNWHRKNSPLGIAGLDSVSSRVLQPLDPDVMTMLAPPIRRVVRAL